MKWIKKHLDSESGKGRRGSRFLDRFEQRSHVHRLHPSRLWRLLLGIGLFTFGIINIFIPGPGGSVMILGSAFIFAGESKYFAKVLDWGEVRFARQVDWVLANPVIAVIIISATVFAVVSGVGAYVFKES